MPAYKVVLRRRWFGEELEQKVAEYDHLPEKDELLQLAHAHRLGTGATLHVMPLKGKGSHLEYTVRDLTRQ